MNQFVLNVLLALVWCLLFNDLGLVTFLTGFFVGAALLYFARLHWAEQFYLQRGVTVFRLIVSFVYELTLANLTVVRQVLSIPLDVRPGIVAYPLEVRTDLGITTLANLISLTPGTLSLEFSTDHRILYIHTLNVEDPVRLRRTIREAFEVHLLELEGS